MSQRIYRRSFLRTAGALSAAALVGASARRAAAQPIEARRYLFVVGALGGANILDSFMPLVETSSPEAPSLTSFTPQNIETVPGVDLQCVAPLTEEIAGPPPHSATYAQRTFLQRHGTDTAVMTLDHSSVNHGVGQQRALNGGGIDRGRTLLEAVADCYGEDLPLAAVNMMAGEFARPGSDPTLSAYARAVAVADARYFALGTHGSLGLPNAVDHNQLQAARRARGNLEEMTAFGRSFAHVRSRQRYLELRERAETLEASGLSEHLSLLSLPGFPEPTELGRILELLPNLARDPFEAQAALAFLLVKHGGACAVGLSPSDALAVEVAENPDEENAITNPALAFDSSHNNHRLGQHVMWSRLLRVTDALITLLKETPDPQQLGGGSSMWDHSLIYVATEFGRTRTRPPGFTRFGTGHYQNNGVVLVSPLLHGGRAYGAIDPHTGLTYGFGRGSGEPMPGSKMTESDVYSVVCEALGVDFAGRVSTPSMIRG